MCKSLDGSKQVQDIVSRATSCSHHTNHCFLTFSQLEDRFRLMREERTALWFQKNNVTRKVQHLLRTLDIYKKLVLSLRQNDVPRLRQLISTALKNGRSVNYIVDKVSQAVDGVYHAKGFTDDDIDLAFLVMRIGGPRLLHTMHVVFGFPSASTLYKHGIPRFLVSPGEFEVLCLQQNIDSMLSCESGSSQCLWVLMWDEVATEQRIRWNPRDNRLYGFCREHGKKMCIELNTAEDVFQAKQAVDQDEVHICCEMSVIAVAPLRSSNYKAIPLLALPSCKRATPESQMETIIAVLNEWMSNPKTKSLGPVASVASDGDSSRRAALEGLLAIENPPSEDLAEKVSHLPLLDTMVGPNDVTTHYDDKHMVKRFREVLKSPSRGCVVNRFSFNGGFFEQLLHTIGVRNVDQLLKPADAQNVPAAVSLLQAIAAIPQADQSNFSPLQKALVPELQIVATVCRCLLATFNGEKQSLTEQLTSVSCLAHLLLVLYRHNGTKLMPAQLYHDIQATVQDIFYTIAKMQLLYPTQALYLFQLGDDRLEDLFGVLRTLTHDRNFDLLQAGERLGIATHIAQIFEKHPQWKQPMRRLQGGLDHMNTVSWVGDCLVRNVDVKECWMKGRFNCVELLSDTKLFTPSEFDFNQLAVDLVSIAKPRGKLVGVSKPCEINLSEEQTAARNVVETLEMEDFYHPSDTTTQAPNAHVSFEGQQVHKASVVRIIFSSDPRSADRLKRVRGFSKFSEKGTYESRESESYLHIADPFAALVRIRGGVVFGIFAIQQFKISNKSVLSLPADQLQENTCEVFGSVMGMKQSEGCEVSGDMPNDSWIWDQTIGTKLPFKGRMIQPLNPTLVEVDGKTTYILQQEELSSIQEMLWSAQQGSTPRMPLLSRPELPYHNFQNDGQFVCLESGETVSSQGRPESLQCYICTGEVQLPRMRLHIAYHQLSDHCHNQPCGFCGRSGTCSSSITKTSKRAQGPTSTCPYFYKFSLKSAQKGSSTYPSTNVPLECPQCVTGTFIWKYNMKEHWAQAHPTDSIPSEFHITDTEQAAVLKQGKVAASNARPVRI